MKLNITGKNMEITDSLQERIQKKLGKLDKFLNESEEVNVRLSQEKLRNTVEITINLGGDILRVEETSNDMYNSIDGANDKIVRQIRRHRTKLEKRLRVNAFQDEVPAEDEEESVELVRVKRFAVKPMSVDDAIAQMEMLGHSFYLFLNAETDTTCVVYKREAGNYGLLESVNA